MRVCVGAWRVEFHDVGECFAAILHVFHSQFERVCLNVLNSATFGGEA